MVSQGILIGIAVGVFFAGLGIGYAALQPATVTPMMMSSQAMQQMMNDPQAMNQWQQQMMDNPQSMNQWMNTMMNDPQTMQQMHDMMMSNPQHMNQMMGPMMDTMMNDPQMQKQMMTHMMGHQGMMNSMMSNQDMMNMMGGHMMGQGMMGSGMMMGQGMMMPSQSATPSVQATDNPQTRTFDIILDEVEFFAEVENEEGAEEVAFVELHQWNPNLIVVNEGDTVVLNISNPRKHTHTFSLPEFGVTTKVLEPRTGSETVQFVADKAGTFTFTCGLPYNPSAGQCDPDHAMMTGTLIVQARS